MGLSNTHSLRLIAYGMRNQLIHTKVVFVNDPQPGLFKKRLILSCTLSTVDVPMRAELSVPGESLPLTVTALCGKSQFFDRKIAPAEKD